MERAIFLIKPDGQTRSVQGEPLTRAYPLPEIIEGLINSVGLKIVEQKFVHLTEESLRKMYPILNKTDEKFGDGWKIDLIAHLTGEPMQAILLSGENAQEKAKNIKLHLRKVFADPTSQRGIVVENVAHVADHEDYQATYEVMSFEK